MLNEVLYTKSIAHSTINLKTFELAWLSKNQFVFIIWGGWTIIISYQVGSPGIQVGSRSGSEVPVCLLCSSACQVAHIFDLLISGPCSSPELRLWQSAFEVFTVRALASGTPCLCLFVTSICHWRLSGVNYNFICLFCNSLLFFLILVDCFVPYLLYSISPCAHTWFLISLRVWNVKIDCDVMWCNVIDTIFWLSPSIESCNWIDLISVAYASWYHWNCGRTQRKAATINQLACPSLQPLCSADRVPNVLPQWDEGSSKPCAVIEALLYISPTHDLNPGGRIQNHKR